MHLKAFRFKVHFILQFVIYSPACDNHLFNVSCIINLLQVNEKTQQIGPFSSIYIEIVSRSRKQHLAGVLIPRFELSF